MSQLTMGEESPNSGKEPEVAPISWGAGLKLVSEGRGYGLASLSCSRTCRPSLEAQGSQCCLHRVKAKCGIGDGRGVVREQDRPAYY